MPPLAVAGRGGERRALALCVAKCTDVQEMPRYKGIGKTKKRKRLSPASAIDVRSHIMHIMVNGSGGARP